MAARLWLRCVSATIAVALLLVYGVPSASAQRKKEVRTLFPATRAFPNEWGLRGSVLSFPTPFPRPFCVFGGSNSAVSGVGFEREESNTLCSGDVESESGVGHGQPGFSRPVHLQIYDFRPFFECGPHQVVGEVPLEVQRVQCVSLLLSVGVTSLWTLKSSL